MRGSCGSAARSSPNCLHSASVSGSSLTLLASNGFSGAAFCSSGDGLGFGFLRRVRGRTASREQDQQRPRPHERSLARSRGSVESVGRSGLVVVVLLAACRPAVQPTTAPTQPGAPAPTPAQSAAPTTGATDFYFDVHEREVAVGDEVFMELVAGRTFPEKANGTVTAVLVKPDGTEVEAEIFVGPTESTTLLPTGQRQRWLRARPAGRAVPLHAALLRRRSYGVRPARSLSARAEVTPLEGRSGRNRCRGAVGRTRGFCRLPDLVNP